MWKDIYSKYSNLKKNKNDNDQTKSFYKDKYPLVIKPGFFDGLLGDSISDDKGNTIYTLINTKGEILFSIKDKIIRFCYKPSDYVSSPIKPH